MTEVFRLKRNQRLSQAVGMEGEEGLWWGTRIWMGNPVLAAYCVILGRQLSFSESSSACHSKESNNRDEVGVRMTKLLHTSAKLNITDIQEAKSNRSCKLPSLLS